MSDYLALQKIAIYVERTGENPQDVDVAGSGDQAGNTVMSVKQDSDVTIRPLKVA